MKRILGIMALSAVIMVGCGNSEPATITQDEFKQLKEGMTYEEVTDIIGGDPKQTSELDEAGMTEYEYTGEDGVEKESLATLYFKDEKLNMFIEDGLTTKREEENNKEETDPLVIRKNEIESTVRGIVEEFRSTSVKNIEINDHLGTDKEGDFINLIYLSFDAKNSVETTKKLIDMYNNELGAQLAKESDIEELTLFWEVPYHLEGANAAKASLKRSGDNMQFESTWYDPVIR